MVVLVAVVVVAVVVMMLVIWVVGGFGAVFDMVAVLVVHDDTVYAGTTRQLKFVHFA